MAPEFSDEEVHGILAEARKQGRYETRWRRRALYVVIAATALLLGVFVGQKIHGETEAKEQAAAVAAPADDLSSRILAKCAGPERADLIKVLPQVCSRAERTKDAAVDVDGSVSTPKNGVDGLNGRNGVDGRDGRDGKDGKDASQKQVNRAAQQYLPGIFRLLGPELLAVYCATNNCVGPEGKPGADGQDGDPGVGIVDVSCNSFYKITLRVRLSNGQTVEASCGTIAPPDEEAR